MPRNKARFTDLKDKMITALSSGNDPKTSYDTGLAKFSKWYLEPQNRQPLDAGSVRNRGGSTSVVVRPFSLPAGDNAIFFATASNRTANWLKTNATVLTATAIETAQADIDKAKMVKGFYSAQAILREIGTTVLNPTSDITGRKYKTRSGPSQQGYVLPFGTNTAGTRTYSQAQDAIVAALPELNNVKTMTASFRPEEYNAAPDAFAFV